MFKFFKIKACVDNSLDNVYGDSAYNFQAHSCAVSQESEDSCSCVTADDLCFSYSNIRSGTCKALVTTFPREILMNFSFSFLCTVVSMSMCLVASFIFYTRKVGTF